MTELDVAIRSAEPTEYPLVGELLVRAYDNISDAVIDPDYNRELGDVAGRVDAALVLVALLEGVVVGSITYVDGGPLAELSALHEAEIRMFAVDSTVRGKGIGAALLAACVDLARRDGRERLWLSTSPWMKDAQRLYERFGFRRVPTRDRQEPSSGQMFELWAYLLEPIPEPRSTAQQCTRGGL